MNVYDFDETVFTGDSEDHFFAYLEKKPGFRLVNWKYKCYNFLVNSKLMTKTKARQHQYAFLKRMENLEQTLEDYWDTQIKFMKPWYLKAKRDDDIIASATPEFLMVPIMKRLRLKNLVATDMDPKTGKINGEFAAGPYKVDAYVKKFKLEDMDNFYSDS